MATSSQTQSRKAPPPATPTGTISPRIPLNAWRVIPDGTPRPIRRVATLNPLLSLTNRSSGSRYLLAPPPPPTRTRLRLATAASSNVTRVLDGRGNTAGGIKSAPLPSPPAASASASGKSNERPGDKRAMMAPYKRAGIVGAQRTRRHREAESFQPRGVVRYLSLPPPPALLMMTLLLMHYPHADCVCCACRGLGIS